MIYCPNIKVLQWHFLEHSTAFKFFSSKLFTQSLSNTWRDFSPCHLLKLYMPITCHLGSLFLELSKTLNINSKILIASGAIGEWKQQMISNIPIPSAHAAPIWSNLSSPHHQSIVKIFVIDVHTLMLPTHDHRIANTLGFGHPFCIIYVSMHEMLDTCALLNLSLLFFNFA